MSKKSRTSAEPMKQHPVSKIGFWLFPVHRKNLIPTMFLPISQVAGEAGFENVDFK